MFRSQNQLLTQALLALLLMLPIQFTSADAVDDLLEGASALPEGFLDLRVNHQGGQVWLSLDPQSLPGEMLYVTALERGLGSNDIGLDRGQLHQSRLVRWERQADRLLLVEPNLSYRAVSDNSAERRAVEEAFASSVLAAFPIAAENEQTLVVDLAPLLTRDMTGIARRIAGAGQGNFKPDASRSVPLTREILNFPENTLLPALLTFSAEDAGDQVRSVTPTADSLSLSTMHQFVALPEPGYQPRQHHPRSGYFEVGYRDYAAPLGQPMDQRLIVRHRMEPGEPLVYYVDAGAPEPVRSALLDGARWWADAFAAAGFPDVYRVEVLPEGIHPLDVRYNVIQWVHRSTRGWSYGMSVIDPRTGELLKGHVSLGSLRVRQDQMIAEALTRPFGNGDEASETARTMALARLRQLSAHEVGHTLGLAHNFAASYSGDNSVMDYPHPNLRLGENGQVDLSQAYATGVSAWDKLAVRYGYTVFEPGAEQAGLQAILQEASDAQLAFIADEDARVPGAAQTQGHLWDNGTDVLERLDELLAIRQQALAAFSPEVLPAGTALFEMERRLVPVYLLHRYQIEAVAKLVAGIEYDYRLRGEGDPRPVYVERTRQQAALQALLGLLEPEALALPENLRSLIPPPAQGWQPDREFFSRDTGPGFDHLAPARAQARLVVAELLQPARLGRALDQWSLDSERISAAGIISQLLRASWFKKRPDNAYEWSLLLSVRQVVLQGLMALAADANASALVRDDANEQLRRLADYIERRDDPELGAAAITIERFLNRPWPEPAPPAPAVPPGSPIGAAGASPDHWLN